MPACPPPAAHLTLACAVASLARNVAALGGGPEAIAEAVREELRRALAQRGEGVTDGAGGAAPVAGVSESFVRSAIQEALSRCVPRCSSAVFSLMRPALPRPAPIRRPCRLTTIRVQLCRRSHWPA